MSIDNSAWSRVNQMRAQLARINDQHLRTMARAWASAWDETADELNLALDALALDAGDGKVTRAAVLKSQRLLHALDAIEGKLNALFEQSGQLAIDSLHDVVEHAGVTQERIIAGQLPQGERDIVQAWSRVDPEQIAAIVTRSTEQITKLSYPLSSEATATMKRELVRGMVSGSNPRVTAARMVKRTAGLFNGGLSRALTIARTETLTAHRDASLISRQANADILTSWIWTCELSARTCPACLGMNGTQHPVDEGGPDGHQNCRCVAVPKAKSWKDLGFDIDEPASIMPDSQAYFDGLPESEQLNVLGRGRFDAYKAGNFPMSDWATKQSNPGWRDSYVTAKVPAA